jgi:ribonuclease Z
LQKVWTVPTIQFSIHREYFAASPLLFKEATLEGLSAERVHYFAMRVMSLLVRVLGGANGDNGLYVEINTGQSIERLMFDCGEGVPTSVPFTDLISLNHLCFSHGHMDHVAGFAAFFRRVYGGDRQKPVIWGPAGMSRIVQHQMQGFLWNLVADAPEVFTLVDVSAAETRAKEVRLAEGFAVLHEREAAGRGEVLFSGEGYDVSAVEMDHGAPSLAYVVREHAKVNVDTAKMAALGLRPGKWMQDLKGDRDGTATVDVAGAPMSLAELRALLLVSTPGSSVAYSTDVLLDGAAMTRLVPALLGVDRLVCESQYQHEDLALAVANRHMTSVQAAELAEAAGVGELTLIHVSDRYDRDARKTMLREAKAVFPNTRFPDEWEAT